MRRIGLQWRWLTILTALVAALATALLTTSTASARTDPTGPAQANFVSAFLYSSSNPMVSPPDTNNWGCKPTAIHPYPVVLVHGTAENMYDNWAGLSPLLAADGYCVFALNYGGASGSVLQGTGEIAASAAQLAGFVSQVLTATGAKKVDLVGHSQGGMMPRYYLKYLGGQSTVDKLVALVPSNHGTTLDGLAALATEIPPFGAVVGLACPACDEQIDGSTFITNLNAGQETYPTIAYTVISTTHDEVVTPYTSAFLAAGANVTNETVQQYCPADPVEHINISYDAVALQLTQNALDPAMAKAVVC